MQKRFKLVPEMEGPMARWYAKQRGSQSQLAGYRTQATKLTAGLPAGADILEVAPGPGYLAVELARLDRYTVTGLDISRTFVQIATEHAARTGTTVDFCHGDATAMPFADNAFDLVVCQAAFKNFLHPVRALDEMYRVLRPGGVAIINDMNREAGRAQIADEVAAMKLTGPNAYVTRTVLGWLRRRAMSPDQFRRLAAESRFGGADVTTDGISVVVRLRR
jgi:ubiquinone/menaquinone biosynthesis C-methylase UbiE